MVDNSLEHVCASVWKGSGRKSSEIANPRANGKVFANRARLALDYLPRDIYIYSLTLEVGRMFDTWELKIVFVRGANPRSIDRIGTWGCKPWIPCASSSEEEKDSRFRIETRARVNSCSNSISTGGRERFGKFASNFLSSPKSSTRSWNGSCSRMLEKGKESIWPARFIQGGSGRRVGFLCSHKRTFVSGWGETLWGKKNG